MRKGWEYKKLGEVSVYPNKRIQISELNPQDYVGVENLQKNKAGIVFSDKLPNTDSAIVFSPNDILIGNIRPYLKKIWLADKSGGASGDVIIIRICTNDLMPMYLYRVLASDKFFEYANTFTKGAKMPRGDRNAIAKFIVPLPPKSTQLAIVSELDKINELIRLKKEQLKDFDNLAQSLFYEMFGDPVENEKGWEVKKLKDISREIGDGLHGTPEYSEVDTGCYFINGNNLENGTIVIKENTKMVSEKTKAKHYIEMDDFTILVSINGTLGKVAFYNGENVILGKSACYIKLEAYNDKKYIFELLKSDYFKRYAESECTGTTIRNVSLKSMRNFRCPLPPLPLQRLFAQRIEQIEREKSEVQKSIQDLETLLASRMQYWFE